MRLSRCWDLAGSQSSEMAEPAGPGLVCRLPTCLPSGASPQAASLETLLHGSGFSPREWQGGLRDGLVEVHTLGLGLLTEAPPSSLFRFPLGPILCQPF